MKISKSRIKQLVNESVIKILKENTEASGTHFKGTYGIPHAIKSALKPTSGKGGVTEEELKKDFAVFKDENYRNYMKRSADSSDDMSLAISSISDEDIKMTKDKYPRSFKN